MQKSVRLYLFLAAATAVGCLSQILFLTFAPAAILPPLDLMWIIVVSLAALVLEHYTGGTESRCWFLVPVFGALNFALLPWASGLLCGMALLKFAVVGAVAFTVLTGLFALLADRLASGKYNKLAPLLTAFTLFLALQGTMGMLL